jgi:hypothetical protein
MARGKELRAAQAAGPTVQCYAIDFPKEAKGGMRMRVLQIPESVVAGYTVRELEPDTPLLTEAHLLVELGRQLERA